MSNPNPNWRPNWLDRWGYKIPPLEPIEPSDLLTEKQKLVEKETQERVDKSLQSHAEYMPEETKNQIRAIVVEAQARIGFAPNSPKLSLVSAKPQAISRLKRFFLKKS